MKPKEHLPATVEPFPGQKRAETDPGATKPVEAEPAPAELAEAGPAAGKPTPPKPAAAKPAEANAPTCDPPEMAATVTPIFQRIQSARKRPLFVLAADMIDDEVCQEVYRWRGELAKAGASGDLDILIHSCGGDLNACYQVARLFARRANSWDALVPAVATSGATLICLGSSNIVMSEVARLSPIDPQVISKRNEKFFAMERQSPLEAFQALRYLTEVSLETVCGAMIFLLAHGVAPRPALESAVTLAYHTVQPMLGRIEPYDLGAFSLDSNLAVNYCERIGSPEDAAKKTQRDVSYLTLVERYPAHEFVIDFEEARALKFKVSEPSPELDELFEELGPHLDELGSYIGRVPESEAKA